MSASPDDLVGLVNPLQGTDSDFDFSRGNCLPLVARPFGMTDWTPQSAEGRWLYDRRAAKLQGIRATHQPSPWIADYGQFTLMPQIGPLLPGAAERASFVRPGDLRVAPDSLSVLFWRYQTRLELTATERCAALRLTFPPDECARLLLSTFDGPALLQLGADGLTLGGYTRANSGGVPEGFACYIAARFERPFSGGGYTRGAQTLGAAPTSEQRGLGVYVEFDTRESPTVELRIATSFISEEQARRNLERETGGRSFDDLRAEAHAAWNQLLGRALVEGGSDDQRRTFYTALYRSLLFPRKWHEPDATGAPIHYSPYDGALHPGVLYADNGFWDTFRTVYPLLALLYPDMLGEILEGWVQAAREGGWFPTWASPGYRVCMIGTHLDAVIGDAVAKGIGGFDVAAAYAALRRDAFEPGDPGGRYGRAGMPEYLRLGYVTADGAGHAAAATQEYAYDDFCIAQVARALGHEDEARELLRRAFNYRNTYDPATGFMRGRLADGSWLEPFSPFAWDRRAYIEGGAWQYSWAVPHDPAGLIALMGGRAAFVARLDEMLATPPRFDAADYDLEIHEMTEMAAADFGQYAHSNQPVHHVLYLYAAAGQPWKTEYWVRRVMAELYGPEHLPGDEDNGEMSAWYVFSALGFFPLCPGHPSYVLGSPLFERATLRLPSGRAIVIEAPGSSASAVYVRGLTLDGAPYRRTWIGHKQLAAGARLTFEMGAEPDTGREIAGDDLPFSLSTAAAWAT